jgi:hypothetical protein
MSVHETEILGAHGVTLTPGLTEAELTRAEALHEFRFPPDLHSLLSLAFPVGERFPDWRDPESEQIRKYLAWPLEGIQFDIEHNGFWWEPWGPRPEDLGEAFEIARVRVEEAPRLIPVYGHRYLPAEPDLPGNPVFSVYQTDIILYGVDLRSYLASEFGVATASGSVLPEPRRIRFWTDLVEMNE